MTLLKGGDGVKIINSSPLKNEFFTEALIKSGNTSSETEGNIINIYRDVHYQEMLGFGGAFTEASAYNYSLMDEDKKKAFIKAYFDKDEGIGYNFGRTHINSCDFSLDEYMNVAPGDETLASFNIDRDKKYIIPFLSDVVKYTGEGLVLFASPWSPPGYMKDNGSMKNGGKLKTEYKRLWAKYFAKYIKAYEKEGIKISAVSVQNEPKAVQTWESCSYTAEEERDFAENYLIPVFDEEKLSDVKIIIWDHNKERVYDRAKTILESPKVKERVWAVGHHWYSGDHYDGLTLVSEQLHKPNILTEFCASIRMTPSILSLAERYAKEICECINHYCIGICDWNLMLDSFGGPYHDRFRPGTDAISVSYEETGAGCYAPVMFDEEDKSFNLTPVYYYIGHFSKFIKRGAVRVAVTKYTEDLYACAFINPDGETLSVIMNPTDCAKDAVLRIDGECTGITIAPHSICTVIFD